MGVPTTAAAPASTATVPTTAPTTIQVRSIVELACRAPSIHNTQPWLWEVSEGRLRLYADPRRRLPHADPDGRHLVLSCGAALHHARVAAEGLGWRVEVDRCPDESRPDLLATLTFSPAPVTPDARERLGALRARVTDRRRFTSWPLPTERLHRLAERAAEWGAMVLPITEPEGLAQVERLLCRAEQVEHADETYAREAAAWIGGSARDGVPLSSIPSTGTRNGSGRPALPSRFDSGRLADPVADPAEQLEGLMALCTVDEERYSWLRCGETLSALWLAAVREGLSLLPLSQVTEVPETRDSLRRTVLGGGARPQLLVRLGWQEITRRELPATPRRPVDEVLRVG